MTIGKGDGFFDREKEAAFGTESEVLVFDLDEACRGDFAFPRAIDSDPDFTAAFETAFFFPEAIPFRGFEILRDDRVAPVLRGQTVHDEPMIKLPLDHLHLIQGDEIFVFGAIQAQESKFILTKL